MSRLQAFMNTLIEHNHLVTLKDVLQQANEPEVTFWGDRVVTVNGYAGSVSLDTLAKKVLKTEFCGRSDQARGLQLARSQIVDMLKEFYNTTDKKIQDLNGFSKWLDSIQTHQHIVEALQWDSTKGSCA